MSLRFGAVSLFTAALVAPTAASAKCQVQKLLELPVTMVGQQPTVIVQINGRDARMLLDSGAFFSTLARANALEYGLRSSDLEGARLQGIGGDTSMGVATAKELRIGGQSIRNIQFAVGGSDTGLAGILGQNILGIADVEYDLPHGIVRLMKPNDCKGVAKAYWAGAKPFTTVTLQAMSREQRHTIGAVTINGKPIQAVFDTGAQNSILTMAAAKRLGVTPASSGVVPDGFATGLGQGHVPSYRAKFASIDIGGELIRNPSLTIADTPLLDADMLMGIDFFLTHRIYVDNQARRLFVTYEGGPLFGLNPRGAIDNAGARLDLTDKAGDPTDAAGYARRGALAASRGKFPEALADLDKAVLLAPQDGSRLYERAEIHLANRQKNLAMADLGKALTLAPRNVDARMLRAAIRLDDDDRTAALADLRIADADLAPSSDARLRLAGMFDAAHAPDAALASYDGWLKAHPEDSDRARAFNGRCWARAQLGTGLDKALGDCDNALRLQPGTPAYLDSRALVRLRRGENALAIADYDRALAGDPRSAWSLYARGIARRRTGHVAQADADRAAALAIDPHVGDLAKRIGLDP